MRRALFLLGYLWALPLTLAGLLLALVTLSRPIPHLVGYGGALFFRAGPLLSWFHRWQDVIAFTWGGVVVWHPTDELSPRVVKHELVHFAQARKWGALFPAAYAVAAVIAWAEGGHPYWDNSFEREADSEARP